jgi:protein-S-isoprenylcysteine O-methyltransferase Ste14
MKTGINHTCDENCGGRRTTFRLLVVAQFLIAGGMVLWLDSPWRQLLTATLAISGIAVGLWAIVSMGRKTMNISPTLRSEAQLIVKGPYRFLRHPMYTGLLMFCGAFAISDQSWLGLQLWVSLLVVVGVKSGYEEGMLRRRFPEYVEYANQVKRFIPFVV